MVLFFRLSPAFEVIVRGSEGALERSPLGLSAWQFLQGVVLWLLPYGSEKLQAPALLAAVRVLMARCWGVAGGGGRGGAGEGGRVAVGNR